MQQYKAYAKVNVFLKITGKRGAYHEIISRFMIVKTLYDELCFIKKTKPNDNFEIRGSFSCTTGQNTIYKAFIALLDYLSDEKAAKLKTFMNDYAIEVKKNIPSFAGLGGGSSDAATFLKMCNEELNLALDVKELAEVGSRVGADVPFFVYGYDSANVSGIGEIVEEFREDLLNFDIFTPDIEISTPKVYKVYREKFYNPIDEKTVQRLKYALSKDILNTMSAKGANDLFAPALSEYDRLGDYYKEGYFFSGSGSSFFKLSASKEATFN